jgi:phosphoribosyl-ATP pyrophosphohydrolase
VSTDHATAPDASTEQEMPAGVGPLTEDGKVPFLLSDLTTRRMSADRLTEETTAPLRAVVATIAATIEGGRPGSSTERSLIAGPHYAAKKIIEEAYELGLAIEAQGDDQVIEEAQQLIYRVLLGVMGRGVSPAAVLAALA